MSTPLAELPAPAQVQRGLLDVLTLLHPVGEEITAALTAGVSAVSVLKLYPLDLEELPRWYCARFNESAELLVFARVVRKMKMRYAPIELLDDDHYTAYLEIRQRALHTGVPIGSPLRPELAEIVEGVGSQFQLRSKVSSALSDATDALLLAANYAQLPELHFESGQLISLLKTLTKAFEAAARTRVQLTELDELAS